MAVPFSTVHNGVNHIVTIQLFLCPTTGFVELQDMKKREINKTAIYQSTLCQSVILKSPS